MNSVPYLPDISSRIKDLPFERRPIESLGAQKLAEKIRIANEEVTHSSPCIFLKFFDCSGSCI